MIKNTYFAMCKANVTLIYVNSPNCIQTDVNPIV